jgi:condensin complex subunit 2
VKNWAGPEHWKLRKPIRKDEAASGAAPRGKREKKEAFKIDFAAPAEAGLKETMKALFAPVARGGLTLPGKGPRARKREELKDKDVHVLPDDMHFSSRDLVTLFLKPDFQVRRHGLGLPES